MRQKRAWITAAALGIMLLFWLLPAPAGMTRAAMQVIGIFAGTLLLWLTVSIDWPSLLCMAALALVPELGMNSVLAAGFGNSTFAFLLFTFLCTYALSRTPFVRRCAVWFVSSRAARRGPWALAVLFFCSVLLLGAVISPTVLFVTILSLISSFKVFREVYLMTGGYPYSSLYMLQHFMNNTFISLDYQKMSSAAVVMAIAMVVIIAVLFKIEDWFGKDVEG